MDLLFLVSGPPGSGKTTLMRHACGNEVISVTTRPKRNNEKHGVNYYFMTQREFDHLNNNNELVEVIFFNGYGYGNTRSEIKSKCSLEPAYAIVSVEGMKQIKKLLPNSITIFIDTNIDHCIKNMGDRGDTQKEISKRITIYHEERKFMNEYDYVVKNIRGEFEASVKRIKECLLNRHNISR